MAGGQDSDLKRALRPVPNYERRSPAPRFQQPLSTGEAAKHVQIPPGFELQLFAAEPLIAGNPVAMAWDERGRLWIAESRDYPNSPQPAGQGNDAIKILEDTNHDGRADRVTVFADKLSIVSSLVFANGGIIVSQAGEMVALKDTNGDDRADRRESLIRGWSIRAICVLGDVILRVHRVHRTGSPPARVHAGSLAGIRIARNDGRADDGRGCNNDPRKNVLHD